MPSRARMALMALALGGGGLPAGCSQRNDGGERRRANVARCRAGCPLGDRIKRQSRPAVHRHRQGCRGGDGVRCPGPVDGRDAGLAGGRARRRQRVRHRRPRAVGHPSPNSAPRRPAASWQYSAVPSAIARSCGSITRCRSRSIRSSRRTGKSAASSGCNRLPPKTIASPTAVSTFRPRLTRRSSERFSATRAGSFTSYPRARR